jgi:uncharacterized protein YukE
MTTIRVNPEELEAVAERVSDAEDACQCARTSLLWEFPSLVRRFPASALRLSMNLQTSWFIGSIAMKKI